MFIRWVSAKSAGTKRRYAQLVEGYRVPGKRHPRVRVLLGLGPISQQHYDNIAAALAASRLGDSVVPRRVVQHGGDPPVKATRNLRFADIAVLLEIVTQEGLVDLLRAALGSDETLTVSLVLALVLQRCVEPGSKLEAARWIPKTALPELLPLPLDAINNTRIHRVLSRLASATDSIQARLATHYHQADGGFVALFLDVTDAWFVGQGSEKAEKGQTKEGLTRRKVAIVLMCNEHGYPVRWAVRRGNQSDCHAMGGMLHSVAHLPWVRDTPVICDRAMGKPALIAQMSQAGIRFLTALPRSDAAHLNIQVPRLDVGLSGQEATQQVLAHGFVKVNEALFVKDLRLHHLASADELPKLDELDDVQRALKVTQLLIDGVHHGEYATEAAAAKAAGIDKRLLAKNKKMLNLPDSIKQDILAGQYPGLTLAQARRLGQLEDMERLDIELKPFQQPRTNRRGRHSDPAGQPPGSTSATRTDTPFRAVVYFNPRLFEQKRRNAKLVMDDINNFVDRLNANQANGRGRRDAKALHSTIDAKLRKYHLLTAFTWDVIDVSDAERSYHRVVLRPNQDELDKRRKYDGFTVLAAHPELPHGPAHLASLYRAKDQVEKDFQIIKSVIRLRPVRHRTDVKVFAHVTLCALALLLERVLRRRLRASGNAHSPEAALGELASCMLNLYQQNRPLYSVTELTAEQKSILAALGLEGLADDAVMAERISPR